MEKKHYIVVFMTAPDEETAARIGSAVVKDGLAACCNIVPGLRSIYMWKGSICDEKEVLCILKTRKNLFDELNKRIIELHPYDVPEVICVKIKHGSEAYLKWIDEVTG